MDASQRELERQIKVLRQLMELQAAEDGRLDEHQKAMMNLMISQGIDEREAKLKVMCIAKPPDHYQAVPATGGAYPRTVYHRDGRIKVANDEEDYDQAKKAGWQDKPSDIHVEKSLQAEQKRQKLVPIELPPGGALAIQKERAARAAKAS